MLHILLLSTFIRKYDPREKNMIRFPDFYSINRIQGDIRTDSYVYMNSLAVSMKIESISSSFLDRE